MAVGLVEIPELARPFFERAGGEYPVFAFDGLPDLGGEARQVDRARVPVLARFLRPARALALALLGDLGSARLSAPRVGTVAFHTGLQEIGQHRDRERGVGKDTQVGML